VTMPVGSASDREFLTRSNGYGFSLCSTHRFWKSMPTARIRDIRYAPDQGWSSRMKNTTSSSRLRHRPAFNPIGRRSQPVRKRGARTSQGTFRGIGRGSGRRSVCSFPITHPGMFSSVLCRSASGASTSNIPDEESSITVMFGKARIRSTSAAGLAPVPRYRRINRSMKASYQSSPCPS
jgi:hypothetical protein